MSQAPSPAADEAGATTEDRLLGGRVRLLQPARGYRAGMDAALLAAACDAEAGERVLDVGCGPGAVLLQAAARRPGARFWGLERDPAALELARRGVELNGLHGRAEPLAGDVAQGFAALKLRPFDAVLSNPPFFDDGGAIRGPHPARRGAYLSDDGLEAWIRFLSKAAREGGSLTLIHRADRLGDILSLLSEKCGGVRIRPVHPFADTPAKRVLVRAVKAGKAPLELLPPLVLHDRSGGKHTPEAEAILRGEAALGWDQSA
jgi:tRNA1(Val) A37 N6-methylase TrmN6